MLASAYSFQPSDPPGGPKDRRRRAGFGANPAENEDLVYKVELWDASGASVEQVLAVTSSPSIGYAAYYAATKEFPEATITLRHRNSVMSRWGGKPH